MRPEMSEFAIELSGRVGAPLALVWNTLTDLETVAAWLDRVEDAEASEHGPDHRRWRVGRRWIVGGIVEVEPRRKVVLVLREASSLIRQIRIVVHIAAAERGTAFRVELAGDAAGLATPLKPWLRLRAEIELHRAVRDFRAWIEERAARDRRQREPDVVPAPTPRTFRPDLAGVDLVGA
jgi:uncharacterized protein YndB with AHSA1/START domain